MSALKFTENLIFADPVYLPFGRFLMRLGWFSVFICWAVLLLAWLSISVDRVTGDYINSLPVLWTMCLILCGVVAGSYLYVLLFTKKFIAHSLKPSALRLWVFIISAAGGLICPVWIFVSLYTHYVTWWALLLPVILVVSFLKIIQKSFACKVFARDVYHARMLLADSYVPYQQYYGDNLGVFFEEVLSSEDLDSMYTLNTYLQQRVEKIRRCLNLESHLLALRLEIEEDRDNPLNEK